MGDKLIPIRRYKLLNMRITAALSYFVRRRHIPGKIDIGKNRIQAVINPKVKYQVMNDMIRNQRNIEHLSRPYLSADEEKTLENSEEQKAKKIAKMEKDALLLQRKRWLRPWKDAGTVIHRRMEWELGHLEKERKWE